MACVVVLPGPAVSSTRSGDTSTEICAGGRRGRSSNSAQRAAITARSA